jgi:hypothetical protein
VTSVPILAARIAACMAGTLSSLNCVGRYIANRSLSFQVGVG